MPPKRKNLSDPLDILEARITRLEQQLKHLQNNKILTVPIYNNAQLPTNSVEGQVAIIIQGALQSITVGTVNATSTLSGRVAKIFKFTVATISATSTASASLQNLNPVIPTQISATATVSGGIQKI